MMLICVKQRLSNIWNSIYDKVKQQWGWAEKKALLLKKNSVVKSKSFIVRKFSKARLKFNTVVVQGTEADTRGFL